MAPYNLGSSPDLESEPGFLSEKPLFRVWHTSVIHEGEHGVDGDAIGSRGPQGLGVHCADTNESVEVGIVITARLQCSDDSFPLVQATVQQPD